MKILQVGGLKVSFDTPSGRADVVNGVSFDVLRGETFGLVGQSGSGKTMTALSVLKLISPPGRVASGKIIFRGEDLLTIDEERLRAVRGAGISMVFQEPATAFNPVFTIGGQIVEAIMAHRDIDMGSARRIAMDHLDMVRIPDRSRVYYGYPHQLSGGTKQRAMIAMALVNSPELLILDEPTTALDVTIQARMLDLLEEIKAARGLSVLFISHDFGVIARMCDRVAVMHDGAIVETGDKSDILRNPRDPYTASLLDSVRALA